MPESKKRTQRRKWKGNRRAFRARQKSAQQSENFLSNNTPPGTPGDLEAGEAQARVPQAPRPQAEADDVNLKVDRQSKKEAVGNR